MVVTMDGERRVLEDGTVAVKGDAILAVGSRAEIEAKYDGAQRIDARGKLVLPGLINGHTHVPMTLLRGLKDDVTLDVWLKKYIFPAEAKNVTEDFVRWGTRLAAAEQIRGGVTTFADMYYFEDSIAEETRAAGMRGVLGETILDFPAPDNKTNVAMLEYTEKFLKRWQGDALIHAAVAPHSEISRADPHPRGGDEEGIGRQPRAERIDAGAVPGADRPVGAGRGGGALHMGGRSGPQDSCRAASGLCA
jgi:5-methylthioadenosine/S-adenosylhomocysteine deaminase